MKEEISQVVLLTKYRFLKESATLTRNAHLAGFKEEFYDMVTIFGTHNEAG